MIFDEAGEQQKPIRGSIETPEQARQEIYRLLAQATELGITMWFCKEPSGDEYLEWHVEQGREHAPAIRWMYTNDVYRKLYVWHKYQWHAMQEFIPCTDKEMS